MTWGQWGAAAQVLQDFAGEQEFVEMRFEVIDMKKGRDVAFGHLRRV